MTLASGLVNRLKLKHWALLSALGETPTLYQAASLINVTQPSATKMLADIEHAFGFSLFERCARGMRPTPLGKEVVAYAQQTQASLERFMTNLEVKRQGGHGHLVIGAIMGGAPDLVVQAVSDIKRDRPRLNIRILGESSDQIGVLLERHEVELAVGRFTGPLDHNRFDFAALADEPLRIVARATHPLAVRNELAWDELVLWPWVFQTLSSPARVLIEEEFSQAGVRSPEDVIECSSTFAILQFLKSRDAIAVLPESVLRDHINAGLLATLNVALTQRLAPFGILTRKDEKLSNLAASFTARLHALVTSFNDIQPIPDGVLVR
jgi:DNA-binding transcriptional LysR family regulator